MGLKYRHDLESERGKAMRGWKGLALVEVERAENGSCKVRSGNELGQWG